MSFTIYYTLGAIGLYFTTSWILDRIEIARGERLAYRNVIFFVIIFALAYGYMYMVNPPPDQDQQFGQQQESTVP